MLAAFLPRQLVQDDGLEMPDWGREVWKEADMDW